MKSILSYSDYRNYLRDFYEKQKLEVSGYSYKKFSELAGIKSPNYLKLVIDGQRNLTIKNIHDFASVLKLSPQDLQFFEALVLYNQAETSKTKSYYKKRMKEIKGLLKGETTGVQLSKLVDTPEFLAMAICLEGQPVDNAVGIVKEMLGVSSMMVEKTIAELQRHNFLIEHEGHYHLKEKNFMLRDKKNTNQVIRHFLKSQLDFSKKSFDAHYQKGGNFLSQTFCIPKEDFDEFSGMLVQLMQEMAEKSDQQEWDQVVQFNAQLFPWKSL